MSDASGAVAELSLAVAGRCRCALLTSRPINDWRRRNYIVSESATPRIEKYNKLRVLEAILICS